MKAYSATYLFCNKNKIIKNGIIVLDDYNKIIVIIDPAKDSLKINENEIIYLNGIITPGFVNTHCHLELSAYHETIPTDCSIDGFIRALEVEKKKGINPQNAIIKADAEMWNEGIVAVCDICNTVDSIQSKRESKIHYHNFVEVFGSTEHSANKIFKHAVELVQQYSKNNLPASITPHSMYACSESLMELIQTNEDMLSVHFMESEEEIEFFEHRQGAIAERAKLFGVHPTQYENFRKRPSEIALMALKSDKKLLFVHNTLANEGDLTLLQNHFQKAWFCLCPNSNLYIENRLPDITMLNKTTENITIGTDSLASNPKLSILEELITIAHHFPKIPTTTLLHWATLNGAKFLDIEDQFGTLEVGKAPGLNQIVCDNFDLRTAEKVVKIC